MLSEVAFDSGKFPGFPLNSTCSQVNKIQKALFFSYSK